MSNSIEEDTIKQYINELFQQYDTERKGTLSFSQLAAFFIDLLKTVGITTGYTYQQLYEITMTCNPSFKDSATPEDVLKIFTVMMGCDQNPKPQTSTMYQYPQGQSMPMQFMNPMYQQNYMGAQGMQQMQYPPQWGHNNYMNQGWYRQ